MLKLKNKSAFRGGSRKRAKVKITDCTFVHRIRANEDPMNPQYTLIFMLPGLPATANEMWGKDRMVAYSNAVTWKKRVHILVRGYEPEKPLQKALIQCVRFGTRELDYDGLVASFKPVIDGLCPIKEKMPRGLKGYAREICRATAKRVLWPGILSDDSWQVTGAWEVTQVIVPATEVRIEIRISDRLADPGIEI